MLDDRDVLPDHQKAPYSSAQNFRYATIIAQSFECCAQVRDHILSSSSPQEHSTLQESQNGSSGEGMQMQELECIVFNSFSLEPFVVGTFLCFELLHSGGNSTNAIKREGVQLRRFAIVNTNLFAATSRTNDILHQFLRFLLMTRSSNRRTSSEMECCFSIQDRVWVSLSPVALLRSLFRPYFFAAQRPSFADRSSTRCMSR